MTTLNLNLTTSDDMACACCMPADVIICVNPAKLALETCSGGGTKLPLNTMPGVLVSRMIAGWDRYGNRSYQYTIQYDSTKILAGQSLLPADATGFFCKGCLTTWVEERVGQAITAERVVIGGGLPDVIRITDQYGCTVDVPLMSASPFMISSDAGNLITLGGDGGVFAPVAGIQISSDAGNTTLLGSDGGVYTPPTPADVSADAGNISILGSDSKIYTPSDSIAPGLPNAANGQTVVHTSAAGVLTTLNTAYSSIVTASGDNGVSAVHAVKQFSQNGAGVLTVLSAPEHTSYSDFSGATEAFVATDVNSVATFTFDRIINMSIVNPSALRVLRCLAEVYCSMLLTADTTSQYALTFAMEFKIGGGAWTPGDGDIRVFDNGGSIHRHYTQEKVRFTSPVIFDVPAVSTELLSIRYRVIPTWVASTALRIEDAPCAVAVIGSTV